MDLKKVFFRKMTILYIILIGLLSFELFVVGPNTIELMTEINEQVSGTPYVITYKNEQKNIKGAKIEERVKTASRLIKVDSSLTGNQCIASSDLMFMGQEKPIVLNEEQKVECTVKEYRAFNKLYPYELLVSQETYDSIKDTNYSYLVYFNTLGDLNRIEKDGSVVIRQPLILALGDFYSEEILYQENLVIIGISIIMLFVVIAVLFFNTSYYVRSNTKKTRKKVKDNTLNLTIKSVTLTILLGISIGYVIPHIMSLF